MSSEKNLPDESSLLLIFANDASEVLLEHVQPFLADEDIAGLLGSHRVLSLTARDLWRRRLAGLLWTAGDGDGRLEGAEKKTAAEWKRAYVNCSLSSRLYEGRLGIEDEDLPGILSTFELDSRSFFMTTQNGANLIDAFSGKCTRKYVSDDIFVGHPGLKIKYPLDRHRCLASTSDGSGLSLWDMQKGEQLHGFETSCIEVQHGPIKMNREQFVRYGSNSDGSNIVEVWNFNAGGNPKQIFDLEHPCSVERLSDSLLYATMLSGAGLTLWNICSGKCVFNVRAAKNGFYGPVARFGNDRVLSLNGEDGEEVNIWSISTQACIRTFKLNFYPLGTIGIGEGLCASADYLKLNAVKIWRMEDGCVVYEHVDDLGDADASLVFLTRLTNVSYAFERDDYVHVFKLPLALVHEKLPLDLCRPVAKKVKQCQYSDK